MNELTRNNVHEFPHPVQRGYRSRRSEGERFHVLLNALKRESILRIQSGASDEWLAECVRWADRGCLPE